MIKDVNNISLPRVSVEMITYNHASYIAQAIEGVVCQKTNFPFELVISDDCSWDGTREICQKYAEQYPDKIKLLLPDKNLGMSENATFCLSNCKGEYIAVCEGDDYWTDPFKLQRQVDFLDANPDYVFCCHRFKIYDQEEGRWEDDYAAPYYKTGEDLEITRKLFLKTWITQPLTTVYRRSMCRPYVQKQYKEFRDVHFYYYLLKEGKAISFNRYMGVYRKHRGGVSSKVDHVKNLKKQRYIFGSLWMRNMSDIRLLELSLMKNLDLLRIFLKKK